LHEIGWHHGKNVVAGTEREYGHANVQVQRHNGHVDRLFRDLEDDLKVWMSHGDKLGAVSGGVDFIVAAKPMHEATGHRFHAVCEQVKETLTEHLGINWTVDASDLFLDSLKGIVDNLEAKRRFIGSTFIDVFEAEALKIEEAVRNLPKAGPIEFFLQGTLYPDIIESISFKGPSATLRNPPQPTTTLAVSPNE